MQPRFAVVALLLSALAVRAESSDLIEGFTEPFRNVDVAPAEPGVLSSVLVEEGAVVEAGQLLAALDNEVLQLSLKIAKQVAEARGKYEAACAERNLRAERLKRLQSLQPQGFAHREEVDRAAADLAVAEANVLALEEQRVLDALEYQKTKALLERRLIYSPIQGVVAKVHHEAGEYVAGANPVAFTIVQLNPLRVVFAMPAAEARRLNVDQSILINFPETAQQCGGRIELVSPIIDAESGLVRVKALIPNADGKVPCGARCVLSIEPVKTSRTAAAGN